MLHKLFWTTVGAGVLGALIFGRDLFSYVSTAGGMVRETVKESLPLEFELKRARDMVADLTGPIRKNMHVIAKEEVEVERLKKQIAENEAKLSKERNDLMSLKNDVASGKQNFQYGGRTFTVSQVKVDLSNRFERFKTAEATLASLQQIQTARQKSLEAVRQKLDSMLAAKRQLEVDVEHLEAQMQMVEAARAADETHFDDSHLGRARELVEAVRTRLTVAERLAAVETEYKGEIPVGTPSADNILEKLTEYFDGAKGTETKVAEAQPADNKVADSKAPEGEKK